MTDDIPPRFEDEYPTAASLLVKIYAAKGVVINIGFGGWRVLFRSRLPRNEPCFCGSGLKAKKCHEQFT